MDSLQLPITPEEYMKREKEIISKLWPEVKAFEGLLTKIFLILQVLKNLSLTFILLEFLKQVSYFPLHVESKVATSSYKEVFHLKSKNHQSW